MKKFFLELMSEWWGIAILVVVVFVVLVAVSAMLYRPIFKRFYDV